CKNPRSSSKCTKLTRHLSIISRKPFHIFLRDYFLKAHTAILGRSPNTANPACPVLNLFALPKELHSLAGESNRAKSYFVHWKTPASASTTACKFSDTTKRLTHAFISSKNFLKT